MTLDLFIDNKGLCTKEQNQAITIEYLKGFQDLYDYLLQLDYCQKKISVVFDGLQDEGSESDEEDQFYSPIGVGDPQLGKLRESFKSFDGRQFKDIFGFDGLLQGQTQQKEQQV